MKTINQLDQGRDNNFDLLRFIAATMVVFSHSYLVTANFAREPLARLVGFLDLGALGVKIFFAISGFLIMKSLYRQPTLAAFVYARALRIFPGLLVTALFCGFVIGPVCTTLPLKSYFTDSGLYDFLWRLPTVHNFNNALPGTFKSNPYPVSINSPIWTLAAELLLYLLVLIWGVVLLIWHKRFGLLLKATPVLIVVALFFAGIYYAPWYMGYVYSWGSLFVMGALCHIFSKRIVITPLILVGLLIISGLLFHYRSTIFQGSFNVLLVYGIFLFAYHPRLQVKSFHKLGDLSYGLYIYTFPIQQLIVAKIPTIGVAANFFMAYIPALGLAALSWYYIEKPALKLKSRPAVKMP